jgi:hypothetical protein
LREPLTDPHRVAVLECLDDHEEHLRIVPLWSGVSYQAATVQCRRLWRLDRLGRSLKHLTLLDDLQALGVALVSLAEGIDATTPAGKLQMRILGAIAKFERARIVERARRPSGSGLGGRESLQGFSGYVMPETTELYLPHGHAFRWGIP